MKIGKTFTVNAPLDLVWEFITSPNLVAPCIPGCSEAIQIDETHFKAKVSLAIGPIKTSFSVDIEQVEKTAPTFARYEVKGNEGGQASRVKSESFLKLTTIDSETTQVEYESDVTIVGRLGKFGAGLVQKVADSIGDEFVAALKGKIEGSSNTNDNQAVLGSDVSQPYGMENSANPNIEKQWLWASAIFLIACISVGSYLKWFY
jgi:carbon monoxide dehydrogenase subunit G